MYLIDSIFKILRFWITALLKKKDGGYACGETSPCIYFLKLRIPDDVFLYDTLLHHGHVGT